MSHTLVIDAMTSEQGIRPVIEAVQSFVRSTPHHFLLVGRSEQIEPYLVSSNPDERGRIQVAHADDVIEQSDDPVRVLRSKRASSTHKAFQLLSSGEAQGLVSCANTGAVMGLARFYLKRLPGVKQLALSARYPTHDLSRDIMLADVGASMDLEPQHLWQLARQLILYTTESLSGGKVPSVGVLSIGQEAGKGNQLVKSTVPLLQADPEINYVGLLEPKDLYRGKADIVLCDGFVGNVLLKASEATGSFVMDLLKQSLSQGLIAQCTGWLLSRYLKPYRMKLTPQRRNGGLVLGVRGVVVKAHGDTCRIGMQSAIAFALKALNQGVHEKIQNFSLDPHESESTENIPC